MAENNYFLVADILGFSRMVANLGESKIDQRINQWIDIVERARTENGIDRLQVFSDTVFASVPSTESSLGSILRFARALLTEGLRSSFPVRGGLAHGGSTWGRLTYGQAVIEAHLLESQQKWIGVTCGDLPHKEPYWGSLLACYPSFIGGFVHTRPVLIWEVPESRELARLICESDTIKDGELLPWELAEKLTNTLLFRSYLTVLRGEGLDPSKFHGPLPTQAIDEVLSKKTYRRMTPP
jgi:hypothetical protein